ncbi:hypothetical protein MUN82_00490 [Hymenobacter aerilatus]|uniref:Lipocalin-like domain-containing protein n=1 Tax=Hymenobacter aerilatus TaxID=2932251 RepID=A0A8T9SXZ4_9BACT|nr:hypothetical protein [Hymenobacter aerilatus]UOR05593.1 hypothetical protein MUN82_00490 [Hymenobacter aerilatus]
MRIAVLFVGCLLSLLLGACSKDDDPTATEIADKLEGSWLYSYEESRDDVWIYRPETYAFPPSRGRTGFAFDRAGLFTQYDIAPTDGIYSRPGTWKMDGTHTLIISLDNQLSPDYRLEIVSLKNNVLKVRYLH